MMFQHGHETRDENIHIDDPTTGQIILFPKDRVARLPAQPSPIKPHTMSTRDTENLYSTNARGETAHTGVQVPKKPSLDEMDAVPHIDKSK